MTTQKPILPYDSLLHMREPDHTTIMDTRFGEYDDGGSRHDVSNGNDNSTWEHKYRQEFSRAYNLNSFCLHIGQSLRFMGFDEYSLYYLENNRRPFISIFTTMAEDDINAYFGDSQWQYDPIRDYVIKEKGGILLSTIKQYYDECPFQMESLCCAQVMLAHLESFGYRDLYIIPRRDPGSESCLVLTVATKDQNIEGFHRLVSENGSRLQSLVTAIEYVGIGKFPDIFRDQNERNQIQIGSNSLELLRIMVRDDLKLIDAAKQMNVSRDIANRWIKSVKNALNADTTARAIYLATKTGLIEEKNPDKECHF